MFVTAAGPLFKELYRLAQAISSTLRHGTWQGKYMIFDLSQQKGESNLESY